MRICFHSAFLIHRLTNELHERFSRTDFEKDSLRRAHQFANCIRKSYGASELTGPVFRLLDGGIGYADLDRLELKDVDAMFAAFEKSPASLRDRVRQLVSASRARERGGAVP